MNEWKARLHCVDSAGDGENHAERGGRRSWIRASWAAATRADTWTQVEHYLSSHAEIGNAEIRQLLRTDDPVRASRLLRQWVDLGLLVVANPEAAKQSRRYRRPGVPLTPDLFAGALGKQSRSNP